ncbi:MAG TPA: sigma-70 family RNA polymerase sigma factor [Polyangiaceae bacterium]|jgi:RNA polymerase sigma-70 factor (ECF subfamily)|nr:sigma-70 family RNA polymerase sigma factor [Polyangiaceae bacterium]
MLAYVQGWTDMASSRTDVATLDGGALVFADVYAAHFAFVYRVVARLAGGGDVEDLVQEVFVVVHRRLQEFRGEARLSTWLFRIAYRTVGAHVRRERLRRRFRELLALHPPASSEATSDVLDRSRRVREALDRLSYAERSALVLFEVEGQSAAELAESFGVPVGTVYRRLHDARRKFRAAYGGGTREGAP